VASEIWPAIVLYRRDSRTQRANFAFHHFVESECRNLSPQRGDGESDHDVVFQRPAATSEAGTKGNTAEGSTMQRITQGQAVR